MIPRDPEQGLLSGPFFLPTQLSPLQAVAAGLSVDLAGRACALPRFLPGWWRRPFCPSSSSSCSSWLERSVRSGLGGETPSAGFGAFSSVPSWCPEPPSPSSPPPPLPSPALPLVPGSLRRTHHDGRRRAAPDSVSTRDGGCQAPKGPGITGRCGREQESGAEAGTLGGPWPGRRGRELHSSSVPFSLERKPSLLPDSHFLGPGACFDLLSLLLHTFPRPGFCIAKAVRPGRAPALSLLLGPWAGPGAVPTGAGPGGGGTWGGTASPAGP